MYSIVLNVRTNYHDKSFDESNTFLGFNKTQFTSLKTDKMKDLHEKRIINDNDFSGNLVGSVAISSDSASSCLASLPQAGFFSVFPGDVCPSPVKQSPETDPVSREFRRVSCSQSVRELIHERAQIQDMLIMDSADPWADIQRRTALLDPGFREVLQRHMARAAALLERIERDCQDVLSPEELAECGRLRGAFERMRGYVGADLITTGGELVEASYQRLIGAMRDVASGARDMLGAVITGLGASAVFLMNLLRSQFAH